MCPDQTERACAWAEDRFSAALEGGLIPEESAAFDRHLTACTECREGFQAFTEAVGALQDHEPRPVPQAFFDSVREATTGAASGNTASPAAGEDRTRSIRFSLTLAWSTAAAAAAIAVFVWLTRPAVVEVPVERQVVVEKEKRVPVRVPVQGGGLEVVRAGKVVKIESGDTAVLENGDVLRLFPLKVPAETPPAPVRLVLDTRPLAETLEAWMRNLKQGIRPVRVDTAPLASALMVTVERMAETSRRLAEAAATASLAMGPSAGAGAGKGAAVPVADFERPAPIPPVVLVREGNGVLRLETSGPARELIPELLGLLDEEDPRVAAAAQARLEGIQGRLRQEHGIEGPLSAAPVAADRSGGLGAIRRLFGEQEARPRDLTPGERWRRWWDENRHPILGLTENNTE